MRRIARAMSHFRFLTILMVMVGLFLLPMALNTVFALFRYHPDNGIAPLFTPQVQYWGKDIVAWSDQYDIDPNLMATVMQIESCGHPTVISHAGAQGLFQVMPFHFDVGEDMLNPSNNAKRSGSFIQECLGYANGDVGLALACYNGGPSVTQRAFNTWPQETQRYFIWGLGIYSAAQSDASESATLNEWLTAGGRNLCNQASFVLGITGL